MAAPNGWALTPKTEQTPEEPTPRLNAADPVRGKPPRKNSGADSHEGARPQNNAALSEAERAFYARQLILPEIGLTGQLALKNSTVAVLGAGGLGAAALLYLAGAGVGHIIVIDDDNIEASNLHRQVIHTHARVGNSKAESAAETMRSLNPFITVTVVKERLDANNATRLLAGADAVLDGSDNFSARYDISAAAAVLGIPHIWGAILGFDAQLSVFWAGRSPVYEDIYPVAPAPGQVPTCATAGVLGALAGTVGTAMAFEAIKVITGAGQPLLGELGVYSGLIGKWEYIPLLIDMQATPKKSVVSHVETTQEAKNDVIFRNNSVALDTTEDIKTQQEISPRELKKLLKTQKIALLDVRERVEFEAYAIENAENFPLTEILAAAREGALAAELREKVTPNAKYLVVYCTGYTRTVAAARELSGVVDIPIRLLSGGITGWLTV